MSKKYLVIIGVILLISAILVPACSPQPKSGTTAPIEMNVAFGDASASAFFQQVLVPWGEEIMQRSNGRINVVHHHSGALGPATEHWDLVTKGLADVSWQLTMLAAGLFPLTEAAVLPPTGINSAEKLNRVLWDMYKTNKYFQEEYKDNKVLFYAGGPPQVLWANKEIKTIADVKGMRIGTTGGPAVEAIQLFEATPQFFLPIDMYLALEKGTIDGVAFIAEGVMAFKLNETCKYCCWVEQCPFAGVVSMNWNFWNKLPSDLQKVVEDVSTPWSEKAGKALDKTNTDSAEALKKIGVIIYVVPANEKKQWYDAMQPMLNTWVTNTDKLGLPGQEILDDLMKVANKY